MKHAKSACRLGLVAFALLLIGAVPLVAHGPEPMTSERNSSAMQAVTQEFFVDGGYALKGYDPVAYFLEDQAIRGSENYIGMYHGVQFLFSSSENLDRFMAEPEVWLPEYGGFSVYGAARGKMFETDPEVFDIIDGKLYLSRNEKVRDLWQANPAGYIARADTLWESNGFVN